MAKRLWELFYTFAKVGVMTFGGGYAMLPILQREVVENKGWATEEELADWFAIGQCTPGVIAVNTATLCGAQGARQYRRRGGYPRRRVSLAHYYIPPRRRYHDLC